jgi:hypothetical protein
VAGPIVLIALIVLVFPPILFGGGMVAAALMGQVLTRYAEETHEGSEFIQLNR